MNFYDVTNNKSINEILRQRYERTLVLRAIYGKEIAYKTISLPESYTFEQHYMDSSTGTLREVASLLISNADLVPGIRDYDGVRDGRFIECKPRLHTGIGIINGSGNLNDHTIPKHEKAMDINSLMQQSQFFSDGICGWIIEFPYRHSTFVKQMEKDLHKSKGRICGSFYYKHWIDCLDINVRYINKDIIYKNREIITGGRYKTTSSPYLYQWLMEQNETTWLS